MNFQLTDQEFNMLMFVLSNAEGKGITWSIVNPLVMKIGEQARIQKQLAEIPQRPLHSEGNGQETREVPVK